MRNELIGEVRDMITGFLKNNRMELPTGRRNNIVPARRSWIPLKNRETVLMMHEIAVGCINVTEPVRFGLRTRARGSGKGPVPARGSAPTGLWVPAWAVLALLL